MVVLNVDVTVYFILNYYLLTFELLLNISLSLSYFNTANFYDNAQHSQLCMITMR